MNSPGSYALPKAPPNDPERAGNIWQQYEQLQANHKALQDQMAAERTQYLQEKRTTDNAVGVLLEENHTLHLQVQNGSSGESQAGQDDTASVAGTEDFSAEQSTYRLRSSKGLQDYSQRPRAALQQMFPGILMNGYNGSQDGSAHADSYGQQQQHPGQQHSGQQYQAQQQYYYPHQQGLQYPGVGNAIDQLGQVRAELASKDEHIVHLQHQIQTLKGNNSKLQHTVDDTDSHRRQVQTHNAELQSQLDSLLNEMEGLRQGGAGGYSWGVDTTQMHDLSAENAELTAQLSYLSQQLQQGSGMSQFDAAQLQEKILHLESNLSQLTSQLEARETELRSEHTRELRKIESEKENRMLELKNEQETLINLLTEQNERLETELKDAAETARTAAAAAAASPTATSPRDLSAEDEKKVLGLKATILKLVEDNRALSRLNEHNAQLKTEIQHMMKVKSKNEDLVESNAQLQAEVKRLQQDAASKPVAHDSELQAQMQSLEDEKAALRDHVAQLEQSHRQSQALLAPSPATADRDGQDASYPQTWKLVDQLRNQNRALITEVNELRGSKEPQPQLATGSDAGMAGNRSSSSNWKSIRGVLGLKKNKDKYANQIDRPSTSRTTSASFQDPQADTESLSASSFNDSAAEAERSGQSQVSSQAVADEDLIAVAEERLMQAEQRALKAEEATQAQESIISQLCDENTKLGDEIQRLNGSMDLLKNLTEENSRLIRDNKRANESLDSMLKDISELENRLFDIALQAPDDGGDIFDDAFADPADLAEKKEARKEAAAKESASKPPAAEGVRRASGMDRQMKKRQEETAAEVRLRETNLTKDEERHQELRQQGQEQLETFERVKDKMASPSTPFSLARQRLQRANSGLGSTPSAPSAGSAPTGQKRDTTPASVTHATYSTQRKETAPATTSTSTAHSAQRKEAAPPFTSSAYTAQRKESFPASASTSTPLAAQRKEAVPAMTSTGTAPITKRKEAASAPEVVTSKVAFPPPTSFKPRASVSRPVRAPEPPRGPPLVASPVVNISTPPPAPASTPAAQTPLPRQTSLKSPASTSTPSSPFAANNEKNTTEKGRTPSDLAGAPPTPERLPVGRLPSGPMMSGRLPSGPSAQDSDTAEDAKPGHRRNLSRENSLTRSESGKERLRQEAEASRAEIWRKIQAAKLNNSQKQRAAEPSNEVPSAVVAPPASSVTAPAVKTVRERVQDAYAVHSSTHDIVGFMQQLGYKDFAAAGPEEAKIEQFKRALKLTRPVANINKSPMQKEMATAVYQQLQIWFDQFIYKR